jgi:hypothetical protein
MRTTFTTATFASHHALNRAQTITRKFGLAAAGTLSILFAGASPLRAAAATRLPLSHHLATDRQFHTLEVRLSLFDFLGFPRDTLFSKGE